MQIVGFDVDDLADGNGKAHISFISKELLETDHRMNPEYSDNTEGTGSIGGWEKCEMRSYLNNTIKPLIPVNVRTAMVSVHKSQPAFDTTGEQFTQTTSDDVWIPSYNELFSSSGGTIQPIYGEIFFDSASRRKSTIGETSSSIWWLRSATHVGRFGNVSDVGLYINAPADVPHGVALCFCV